MVMGRTSRWGLVRAARLAKRVECLFTRHQREWEEWASMSSLMATTGSIVGPGAVEGDHRATSPPVLSPEPAHSCVAAHTPRSDPADRVALSSRWHLVMLIVTARRPADTSRYGPEVMLVAPPLCCAPRQHALATAPPRATHHHRLDLGLAKRLGLPERPRCLPEALVVHRSALAPSATLHTGAGTPARPHLAPPRALERLALGVRRGRVWPARRGLELGEKGLELFADLGGRGGVRCWGVRG